MIAEAEAQLHSAADAAFALHLAGIAISSRHVQRVAAEIGVEMAAQRDQKATQHRRRELPARVATAPEVVAVEVDGGRLRTRAVGCGPGVHEQQNKEDKIACLVTRKSEVHPADPQPEPPESFLQPRRVQRLVQQMQGQAGDRSQEEAEQEEAPAAADPPAEPAARPGAPRKHVRTCVASMADCHSCGPLVAAEAQERDFYRATRRAFLGDGAAYNWGIQRGYFPDFVAVNDFLHVLCYIYLAAWGVGGDEGERWSIYVGWLRACWQGRVEEVIEQLRVWQARLGEPPEGLELDAKDPRRLVAEALSYLQNNQSRMAYPRYRQEGLPITSSLAESLVGEFNARVKSKQKYWNRPGGAEAILQLRAAVLSEDERLARFFAERPGNPYRRRKGA
jgi:ribosomal protein L12E/L44/L45/RPP1/RPP2